MGSPPRARRVRPAAWSASTGKLDGRTNLDRSGDAAPAVTPGSVPGDTSLGLGGAEQPSTGTSVPAGGSSPDAAGTTSVAGADPGTGTASGTGSDPGPGTGATSTPPGNAYAGAGNAGNGGTQGNPAATPPAQSGTGSDAQSGPVPPTAGKGAGKHDDEDSTDASAGPTAGPVVGPDDGSGKTKGKGRGGASGKKASQDPTADVSPAAASVEPPVSGTTSDGGVPGAG